MNDLFFAKDIMNFVFILELNRINSKNIVYFEATWKNYLLSTIFSFQSTITVHTQTVTFQQVHWHVSYSTLSCSKLTSRVECLPKNPPILL